MLLTRTRIQLAIGVTAVAAALLGAERFDHKVRNDFFMGFGGNQAAL